MKQIQRGVRVRRTRDGSDTGVARASRGTTAPGAASVMCTSTVAATRPMRSSSTSSLHHSQPFLSLDSVKGSHKVFSFERDYRDG